MKEHKTVDVLRRASGLDLGESEAIIYADDNHADVLLMDEAKGREIARNMGIYIMGTVGVLLFAYNQKILTGDEVEKVLDTLKKSDRHIGNNIINYALSKIQR